MNIVNSSVEWSVALRSSSTSVQTTTRNQLQYRDFEVYDYDTLLSLDSETLPPLHVHLLQALPSVDESDVKNYTTCCICKENSIVVEKLKYLRCPSSLNHVAHEACIISSLIESQSSKMYGNAGAQCPTCQKKSWLFPMLTDDPTAPKVSKKNNAVRKSTMDSIKASTGSTNQLLEKSFDLCIMGSNNHFAKGKNGSNKIHEVSSEASTMGSSRKASQKTSIHHKGAGTLNIVKKASLSCHNHSGFNDLTNSISILGKHSSKKINNSAGANDKTAIIRKW